jgi:hypothetical protein
MHHTLSSGPTAVKGHELADLRSGTVDECATNAMQTIRGLISRIHRNAEESMEYGMQSYSLNGGVELTRPAASYLQRLNRSSTASAVSLSLTPLTLAT